MNKKKTVFVAMSGGVDSSVAALLLIKQGYNVIGAYMKCWIGLPTSHGYKFQQQCTWRQDRRDAYQVAAKLKIPIVTFDFTKEYYRDVIKNFFYEHKLGNTPNPDVLCNKYIKFGVFLKQAQKRGADFIATGHYVRKIGKDLYEAKDKNKDQSYFLWALTEQQVGKSIFPVGGLLKSEVRAIAKKYNLSTANKKDSQGLCFVGNISIPEFLSAKINQKTGSVITTRGEVIGTHRGLAFYTIGQRHGLRIASRLPYYVVKKDLKNNTLIVASGQSDSALFSSEIKITNASWISKPPALKKIYTARIRYRQPKQKIKFIGKVGRYYNYKFFQPQRAVTPGQSLVLYEKQKMLGGGIISA